MVRRKLLIATHNKGKFPEIVKELEGVPFEILNLVHLDFPSDFEVEEPAMTFEGNAIIKAMTIGNKTGLLTLADDSGLEVDALDGRPGVLSARFGPGTDEDRYRKLLTELEGIPDSKRNAGFRCVIALYDPKTEKLRTCEATYRGKLIDIPRGTNGFGYDPIFVGEGQNKTNAELSSEEKNEVSHRGQALRKARTILLEEYE